MLRCLKYFAKTEVSRMRDAVNQLTFWAKRNKMNLNARKSKEIILDLMGKIPPA